MIPRTLHFVWTAGGCPKNAMPHAVEQRIASWGSMNPGWSTRVWRDDDASALENYDLAQRSIQYAEVSDILRYSILWEHGGVYLDTDFEPLRPLDELVLLDDEFVIANEEPEIRDYVTQAFFAARPRHEISGRCVSAIKHARLGSNILEETGTAFFRRQIGADLSRVSIVQSSRMYPFPFSTKSLGALRPSSLRRRFPEACAAHLWDGSWVERGISSKIDLGGLSDHDDYLSINLTGTPGLRADLIEVTHEFRSDSIDEVLMSHTLEHVPPPQIRGLLTEIHRILRLGGQLKVIQTDVRKCAGMFSRGELSWRAFRCATMTPANRTEANALLQHRWMWGAQDLAEDLTTLGFEAEIEAVDPWSFDVDDDFFPEVTRAEHGVPIPNLCVIATKPSE